MNPKDLDWGGLFEPSVRKFFEDVGELRGPSGTTPVGDVREVIDRAAKSFVPLDVWKSFGNAVAQFFGGGPNVFGEVPAPAPLEDTISPLLNPAIAALGGMVKAGLTPIVGEQRASNIDTSGSLTRFVGSLEDVVTNEALLTSGPLTFAQVLEYEDEISGIKIVLVMASLVFSLIVETVSLGQVEGFVGIVLHLIDDVVGDVGRVVSTQLIRRAVGDPLEAGFARIHRHKVLSPSEAEEAYARNLISEAELVDILKSGSFTNDAINAKVFLARIRRVNEAGVYPIRTKFVPPSTLISAYKAQIVGDEELLRELARQGYDDTALAIYWGLAQLKAEPKAPPPPSPEEI